jgi:putative ABC transport system permease protein
VLNRKLLRELRSMAAMLLAVAGIIVVGVACYVTLSSAYRNLTEAKRRYYEQCRMADFSLDLKKAPVTELLALADIPGVAEVRPRIQFYATVDLPGVEDPLNGQILSLPEVRRPILDDIVIRRGSYFTDRRENEVIVNEAFARYHRLGPGQWIRIVLNQRQQELFIVGTAISSEFVYLLGSNAITPDPEHFGVFYVKQDFAEEVFDFKGSANHVLGRLSPVARGNPAEVLRQAEQRLADYGVFTTTPLEDQISNRFLSQEIQGLRAFSVIAPTIFVVVAALVLNVLLTRLAEHQRTVVGTLKALGYSDLQVFGHFLKFGLVVGLTGGVLGDALGWWMAGGLTRIYGHFYQFPNLENHFFAWIHVQGVAISAGCAVLGALRGSRAVLKLQPAEAMRPKPPREGKAVLLERVGWLWRSLSAGWRMVLRNVMRNHVRTAASIFAAAMGSAVLVNSFLFLLSPAYLVDFQFRWILRSDVDLMLKDERGQEVVDEAARLPGVDRAEPVLHVACTLVHGPYRKKAPISGLLAGAQMTIPRDSQERPIRIPSAGLAMNRRLAEILHVQRGDWITVEPIKGQRRPVQSQVMEIAESYLGLTVYAEIGYLSRLVGEELAVTNVQLATDHNPEHRRALHRELKQMPALQAVTAREDMIRSLDEVLRTQWVTIYLLVLFAGIVFFGSILNSSLVSLAERQRELATLRVLGYGPWQIGSLLLRESVITTLIGTVLGMPIGYLLTESTAQAYASDMFRLPVITSPGIWFWTLVLAVFFWLVAHLAVQREIHRMDWLEALKVSE